MGNWYDLTFIQKCVVLSLPACVVIGMLMNYSAKYNNNSSNNNNNNKSNTNNEEVKK